MEAALTVPRRHADIVVMAAAVADFRPKVAADHKLKKDAGPPEIVLEPTTDILAALGRDKRPGQTLVGFAAETDDLRANAAHKLRRKHLDLIVANDVSAPGAGFEHDTNEVLILAADGSATPVALADKRAIASAVLDAVVAWRGSARIPSHPDQEHK
jgi:phosphopantothenoylcysteine decarboxylase/phosphopantothenate--cysteine ligase